MRTANAGSNSFATNIAPLSGFGQDDVKFGAQGVVFKNGADLNIPRLQPVGVASSSL